METHDIASTGIKARITTAGAELRSLQHGGTEFLWQAGAAWPRSAPVLFPIIGRLAGDTLRHGGATHHMTQHGFARDSNFTMVDQGATFCRLALVDDAATRVSYPFAFRFEVGYSVSGASLTQSFRVFNTGDTMLPASFGAHPAFIWPLAPGVAKEAHTIEFAAEEPAPIRRLAGGLVRPEPEPTPIKGRTLALADSLFDDDAVILERPASHSLHYSAPGTATITVAWHGLPQLGIWSKSHAEFLCIEPWHGIADVQGFDGDIADKAGMSLIPPGETTTASVTFTITNSSNPD